MGSYAGIDWASEKHDVLIADEAGERLLAETFAHDEQGITALCDALVCFDVEVVAIERGDGVLVERLLEAGVRVLALHPNQVKAARDRFRASGGKSDRFDCFVLCELARTDAHRFRLLEPDSDQTKALRALTRSREDLVAARVALANQLRAELERFWPGPVGLFAALDSPISLAFLARYPSPDDTRGLGEKRMAAFLKAHRYSRKTPAQLLERLRSAPTGRAGEIETRTRRAIVIAPRRHPPGARRADPRPRDRDRPGAGRAPRRRDLPQLLQDRLGDLRRHPAGRDRRLPAPLPAPRRDRRRRRPGTGRGRVRQTQTREVPLGMQQATTQRALHPRALHLPLEPVGRRPLRQRPHSAATTTAARYAPSAARGAGSSGAAGRPTPPTTPPDTPACNNTSSSPSPHSGPRPDLPATQRMAGAAVTRTAAQRAERAALDSQPPAAISARG